MTGPTPAQASCNLIPVAAASFPSDQGGVVGPIAAPGETVQLELNGCDPSDGFEAAATDNDITITFEPPTGPGNNTDVPVNSSLIQSVTNCTFPGGRCRTERIAVTGDTVVFIGPDGMLRLYEYDSGTNSGTPSVVAPASDFIVDGSIVAFRTDEAVVGQSLNTDSDTVDLVMRAYDLSVSELVSTGRCASCPAATRICRTKPPTGRRTARSLFLPTSRTRLGIRSGIWTWTATPRISS